MKIAGLISADVLERRIFLIRGHKVMLGPYLASLYGIEGISQIVTSLKFSKVVYAFGNEN